MEKGKVNPLLDAAQSIGAEVDQASTGEQQATGAEPQTGSFEAFMGAFAARPGGLQRAAG